MPQVFQQTLWVGGTGEEVESQEVIWLTKCEGAGPERAPGPSSFRTSSGGEALYIAKRGRRRTRETRKSVIEDTRLLRWSGVSRGIGSHRLGFGNRITIVLGFLAADDECKRKNSDRYSQQ